MTSNAERGRGKPRAATTHVAKHARQIADAGDRWFLCLASGLGRLGGWARHEADIAADSAAAAFATTVGVAKKLAGVEKLAAAPHAIPGIDPTASSRTNPAGCASDDPEPSSPDGPREGIDLVPAVSASPGRGSIPPSPIPASPIDQGGALPAVPSPRSSAGVVPLLQALGHTVASYTHRGYESLQQDDRFWTLIHLLQVLGRPNIACAPNEADPPDLTGEQGDPECNPHPSSGVIP